MTRRVRRSCECGRRLDLRGTWAQLRPTVAKFAEDHEACCRATSSGTRAPHRCITCGLLLLYGDACPLHQASDRVPWTEERDEAYRAELEARARGERAPVPVGPAGNVAYAVAKWVDRWEASNG